MSVETTPAPGSLTEEAAAPEETTQVDNGVEDAGVTATADELEQVQLSADAESPQKKKNFWKILLGCSTILFVACCCCMAGYLVFGRGSYSGSSYTSSSSSQPGDAGIPLYGDPDTPREIDSVWEMESYEEMETTFSLMDELDPGLDDLLDYAVAQGDMPSDFEIQSGDTVMLSDGTAYFGLVVGDGTPENSVIVMQGYLDDSEAESGETFLARMGGTEAEPSMILYTEEGWVEITSTGTEEGVGAYPRVSPMVVNPSFERPHGLLSPCLAGGCTTTAWQDYQECVRSVAGTPIMVGLSCAASLTALKAAWSTGPWGVGAAGIAVAASCGAPWLYCIPYAWDNPPVFEVLSIEPDPEGRFAICTFQGDAEVLQIWRPYEVKIKWDDDRRPFADYGVRTVNTLHYGGALQESATDCGGQTTNVVANVPPSQLIEEQPCADICVDAFDGNAHCEGAAPTATRSAEQPAATATVASSQEEPGSGRVVYSGLVNYANPCGGMPGCQVLDNEMSMTFLLEGGEVDGIIIYSEQAQYTDGCPITSNTSNVSLTGTYDAATGTLAGTFSSTWSGDIYTESNGDCTLQHIDISMNGTWQGTYNSHTGVAGEILAEGKPPCTFILNELTSGP